MTVTSTSPQLRIIEGAQELFFRHGLKSITMDDVANHVGMSKKTIYQSYEDKEKLIFEITNRLITHQLGIMRGIREQSKDAIEEMLVSMHSMSKMMNCISPTVFYDMQRFYPSAWKNFQEFKNKHITGYIEENLRSGMDMGLYRENLDTRIMARLRLQEIEIGFNPEVFPMDRFNIPDVQLAMMDHFLHGIVTIKGHRLINKYRQIQEEE